MRSRADICDLIMRQPLLVVLLVLSMLLLGLEVLKEHDSRSSITSYSHGPTDKIPPKTKDWLYLADTDDEAAGQQQALDSRLVKPISGEYLGSTNESSKKVFQLHKLHGVFLI
jgi:hypothetical protein